MEQEQQTSSMIHNVEGASNNVVKRDKIKPVMKPPRTEKFSYEDPKETREATVEDLLLYIQNIDADKK